MPLLSVGPTRRWAPCRDTPAPPELVFVAVSGPVRVSAPVTSTGPTNRPARPLPVFSPKTAEPVPVVRPQMAAEFVLRPNMPALFSRAALAVHPCSDREGSRAITHPILPLPRDPGNLGPALVALSIRLEIGKAFDPRPRPQALRVRCGGDGLARIKRSEPAISAALHTRRQPAGVALKRVPKVEHHGEQAIHHVDAIDRKVLPCCVPPLSRIPELNWKLQGRYRPHRCAALSLVGPGGIHRPPRRAVTRERTRKRAERVRLIGGMDLSRAVELCFIVLFSY